MLANGPKHPEDESDYFQRYLAREEFQQVILNEMEKDVDGIVYPTTSIPTPSRKELDNRKWTTFTYHEYTGCC